MGEISEALRRAQSQSSGATAIASRVEREPHGPLSAAGPKFLSGEQLTIESETSDPGRLVLSDPKSPAAEAYRHAAVRLLRASRERNAHSVLVTSPLAAEGKTTTSCNLAIALATVAGGKRIVFVDLDLRRPAAARVLGVKPRYGVTDVVLRGIDVAAACARTQLPELDLLLAGPPENPLDVIPTPALDVALTQLSRHYDIVLIDSPPILPVPDVSILLPRVDAVLLVAKGGSTRKGALRAAIEAIGREKLIGTFLNESRALWSHRYGYEYEYTRGAEAGNGE